MTNRIETLYGIFSYLRDDSFNKGRASEKIKEFLCNSGYDVHISNECNHNIETLCDEPEFIIITRYNSLFTYDADSNTSGLISTIILSEKLSDYRKKTKFIFFDSEKSVLETLKNYKNVKVINIECVGRGSDILISSNNEKHNTLKNDFIGYLKEKNIKYLVGQFLDSVYDSFYEEQFNMFTIRRANYIKKENKNELVLPWINSNKDTVDKIDCKKIKEVIVLIECYINNKMW
ncbi:hypothetical protein FC767_07835 [Clostridium sporogenes]|uniref:hypothetical protein n=1 Tax=Clostridium sporogenes TaxID=1509 RepID=UPI0013D493D0|nr:hypothetical protein [Clostridium sporogenes]NFF94816.1 hypothetical protein [Clostridium sporogenes]